MTVSFTIDDVADFPEVEKPTVNSEKLVFLLSFFTTQSEEKQGAEYNYVASISGESLNEIKEAFYYYQQKGNKFLNEHNVNGYKIITIAVYPFTDPMFSKIYKPFCITKHETKPMNYLNGPKKSNEFLSKKGKHYA